MKNIVIAGRLTRDAELRRTQNGEPVLGFSVAVDDGYGQNKRALFFDCSLFGKRGESLGNHLGKGTSVTVSGDFSTREHNGKTYLTVRVNELTLQGGGARGSNDDAERERAEARSQQQAQQSGYGTDLDDDPDSIPF